MGGIAGVVVNWGFHDRVKRRIVQKHEEMLVEDAHLTLSLKEGFEAQV
jgi:hypothetical protein